MFYESNDLIVRPYRQGDEGYLAFYSNNKQVAEQMESWFPSPFTYDDACAWVSDNILINNNFAIIYYGDVIGNVGLRNINNNTAEFVLWLGIDFWRKKIGTRVCEWFVNFAKNQLKINNLTASIKSGNIAAEKIANKFNIKTKK